MNTNPKADPSIAILSMQRVVNIGSVLQAYSLREMIYEVTGVTAGFLDIEDEPALDSKKSVKEAEDYEAAAAYSMNIFQRGKRRLISKLSAQTKKRIRRFMDAELCLKNENGQKMYDYVVIGSDEVWNHAKGIRLQLHGSVKQAKRTFTYAASCGSAGIDNVAAEDVQTLRGVMNHLSGVSVRDRNTLKYAQHLYDGVIERHLDPVLVGNLAKRCPKRVPIQRYLLVYAYGQRIRTQEEIGAIQAFAREKKLKTVAIGGSQFWCDFYIPVSPFRALDYFHFADYVVTDTFHGAIFSIIHHRKFAVLVRGSNENKLLSLLEDLGLAGRRVTDLNRLTDILAENIQYDAVEKILARERERTREYLQEQLRG